MEKNNEPNGVDLKNRTCYYFDVTINFVNIFLFFNLRCCVQKSILFKYFRHFFDKVDG